MAYSEFTGELDAPKFVEFTGELDKPIEPRKPRGLLDTATDWLLGKKLDGEKGGSVLEGATLPDPQLDPELNRQAMLKSGSPDSVMFNAGRAKQKVDEAISSQTRQGFGEIKASPSKNSIKDIATGLTLGLRDDFGKNVGTVVRGAGNFLATEALGNQDTAEAGRYIENLGKKMYQDSAIDEQRNQPTFDTQTAAGLYSGARSLEQMAAAAIASGGNPAGVLSLLSAQSGLQGAGEALDKGKDYLTAGLYGAGQAGLEAGTEMLPMGFLAKKFGKAGLGEIIGGYLGRELPTELAATITQNALEKAVLEPEKSWKDYVEQLPADIYQTVMATAVMGTGVGAANSGVKYLNNRTADIAANNAKDDAINKWRTAFGNPNLGVEARQTLDQTHSEIKAEVDKQKINAIGTATTVDQAIAGFQDAVATDSTQAAAEVMQHAGLPSPVELAKSDELMARVNAELAAQEAQSAPETPTVAQTTSTQATTPATQTIDPTAQYTDRGTFPTVGDAQQFAEAQGVADQVELHDTDNGITVAPITKPETLGELNQQHVAVSELDAARGSNGTVRRFDAGELSALPDAQASSQRRAAAAVSAINPIVKTAFGFSIIPTAGLGAYGASYKGNVFVDIETVAKQGDAKRNFAELAIAATGHETAHSMLQKSKDPQVKADYQAFVTVANKYMRQGVVEQRQAMEDAASIEDGDGPRGRAYAENEVMADISGAMWLDHKFWAMLYDLDNGSTMRRIAYRFMQAATRFMKAVKGSRMDAGRFVTDIEAVREAAAKAWATQAKGKPVSRTAAKKALFEAPAYRRVGVDETEYTGHENDAFNIDANDEIDLDFTNLNDSGLDDAAQAKADAIKAEKKAIQKAIDFEAAPSEEEQAALQEELHAAQVQSGAVTPKDKTTPPTSDAIRAAGLFPEKLFEDVYGDVVEVPDSNGDPITALENIAVTTAGMRPEGSLWHVGVPGTWLNGATKESGLAFMKQQLSKKAIVAANHDIASAYRKGTVLNLVSQWQKLAGARGFFKLPKLAKSTAFAKIAKEMKAFPDYDLTVVGMQSLNLTFHHKVTKKTFRATITVDNNSMQCCTMGLDGSAGLGTRFYQVASEYARLNGRKFLADRTLSGINSARRTEQAISYALKTGDSGVIFPGEQNRVYGYKVPKTTEDHMMNIGRLLLASMRNVVEVDPNIRRLTYDPATNTFHNAKGEDAEATVTAFIQSAPAKAFGMGRTTVARAVVTSQILSGKFKADGIKKFKEPIAYSRSIGLDEPLSEAYGEPNDLSPAFKKWFGDSKVVDENGKPMVVYHSTNAISGEDKRGFDVFATKISEMGSHFGTADQANSFGATERRRVMPVFLSIKNPLRLEDQGDFGIPNVAHQLSAAGLITVDQAYEYAGQSFRDREANIEKLQEVIKDAGYDGIVYLNRREGALAGVSVDANSLDEMSDEEVMSAYPDAKDSYIAFDSNQIKSVFNKGSWSEDDDRISYSRADKQYDYDAALEGVALSRNLPSQDDIDQANAYADENGILPYISEYVEIEAKPAYSRREGGKNGQDPVTGLWLNEDGTVNLYVHVTNAEARRAHREKTLRDTTGDGRIHLTNESSGWRMITPGDEESDLGGVVMVKINPALLHADESSEDGRLNFFIPTEEGRSFKSRMQLWSIYKSRKDSISLDATVSQVAEEVNRATALWKSATNADRRGMLKAAAATLRLEHNVGTLLTENGKLEATRTGGSLGSDGKGVDSLGLGLAAAQRISNKWTSCPQSASCEGACLGDTAGGNFRYGGAAPKNSGFSEPTAFRAGARLQQFLKTEALIVHPFETAIKLIGEIESLKRWDSVKNRPDKVSKSGEVVATYSPGGYSSAIRLNVTSDIPPKIYKSLMDLFDDVDFYDYTKLDGDPVSPRHHLTYSSTGASQMVNGRAVINQHQNWSRMVRRLERGFNVAMAFSSDNHLPDFVLDEATGQKFQVWNGDNYDARFKDPKRADGIGMIIGLTKKDSTLKQADAAEKSNGFFIDYDPKRDGNTVVIRDQNALSGQTFKGIRVSAEGLKRGADNQVSTSASDPTALETEDIALSRDFTITVDGKERPTINSNGQRIAATDQGLINFWRWFGDSKVVDADGKPFVVYHGSKLGTIDKFAFEYRGFSKPILEETSNKKGWGRVVQTDLSEQGGSPFTTGNFYRMPNNEVLLKTASGEYFDLTDDGTLEDQIDNILGAVRPTSNRVKGGVRAIFFAEDAGYTRFYSSLGWNKEFDNYTDKGENWTPTTYPVYIRITKPVLPENWDDFKEFYEKHTEGDAEALRMAETMFKNERWESREAFPNFVDYAKSKGYDGYRLIEGGTNAIFGLSGVDGKAIGNKVTWAVFDPTQIKSAIGNNGDFDGTNPDIRYSRDFRKSTVGQSYTLPGETAFSKARRNLQDFFLPVLQAQEALLKQGGTVGEAQNTYRAEERSHGRIEEAIKDFSKKVFEPLVAEAVKADINMDELALYAYAKHAPERNAHIASIDKKLQDGGSGMTNQEAQDIIDAFTREGKLPALQSLHSDLMAITAKTRRTLLDYDLISQDEFDHLETAYKFYVPLRGWADKDKPDSPIKRGSKGFNIRGKETMRALGRTSMAGDLIENIVSDYERAVTRGERNTVGKVFLDFVTTNPDPDLWEIDAVKTKKSMARVEITDASGKIIGYENIIRRKQVVDDDQDSTVAIKVNGTEVYVKVKDERLLRALRLAYKDEFGATANLLNKSLGLYAALMRNTLTRFNPAFAAVNAVRDFGSGSAAVIDELGFKGQATFMKHYAGASVASFQNERDTLRNPEWKRWFDEFKAAGGTTGGYFSRATEDITKDIRDLMLFNGAAPKGKIEYLKAKGGYNTIKKIGHALEILGSTSENAARIAAYRTAREMGKTPAEAASIAKNLTTNFNRKGEWGQILNTLFVFYNAAIQGTARTVKALQNPKVQGLMAGAAAAGFMMAMTNASIGGDDDDGQAFWDKIPDFEKERNFIIMLPPGMKLEGSETVGKGRYIKIPMPYGFSIFPVLGQQIADVYRNSKDDTRGITPGKAFVNWFSAVMGSFNPIGGSINLDSGTSMLMAASPSIMDLGIQLAAGVNAFDRPTSPYKSEFDTGLDSENVNPRQAGGWAHKTARFLNKASGGNEVEPGKIDVMPGTLENLVRNATGGTGVFLVDMFYNLPMKSLSAESEITARDIQILKNFYSPVDEVNNASLLYDRRREILKAKATQKRYDDADMEKAPDKTFDALVDLGSVAQQYTKVLAKLRKEEIALALDESITKSERNVKIKEIQAERNAAVRDFNAEFMDAMRNK